MSGTLVQQLDAWHRLCSSQDLICNYTVNLVKQSWWVFNSASWIMLREYTDTVARWSLLISRVCLTEYNLFFLGTAIIIKPDCRGVSDLKNFSESQQLHRNSLLCHHPYISAFPSSVSDSQFSESHSYLLYFLVSNVFPQRTSFKAMIQIWTCLAYHL